VQEVVLPLEVIFKEEVILLRAILRLQASTDRIHTEVLKAILYLQEVVWKDPVHLEALLQAAGHTVGVENQEALILQDLHRVLHPVHRLVHHLVHHPVEADLQAEADLLQEDVNL
jgi:hypothetical protein